MKWYEQNYVNRRDWILQNLELLGLDSEETVMVLLIDFMNEHRIPIDLEALHKKSGLSLERTDSVISCLCAKKYLEIRASAKSIKFILNGLFETDTARNERVLDNSLFDTFETEFGRPLTNNEMAKISEWNRTMEKKLILYALREASAYQHLKITYIDKILSEWKNKGITAEDYENGKH
ncbi:MAG TPA: DNA replication protein DnaD [Erysipelotrichaceae bacterium]|nr:DNA replication protein DnaD [Erysipelotrichaceae bacterium]